MSMPPGWEEQARRRRSRIAFGVLGLVFLLFVVFVGPIIAAGSHHPRDIVWAVAPFVAIVAVVLALRAYGSRHPGSLYAPSMLDAVDPPARRMILRALRQGAAVSQPEYAAVAVDSVSRVQRARWRGPVLILSAVLFTLGAFSGASTADRALPLLLSLALLAVGVYQLWLVRQAVRAEAANRAIARPGPEQPPA